MMSPFRRDLTETPSQRAAAWVRQNNPAHASKVLQSTFRISQRTAERVLAGDVSPVVLDAMKRAWGRPFIEFVYQDYMAPPALIPDQAFWITGEGAHVAPAGLEIGARLHLKRSPADGIEFAAVARRNLGWVSAIVSGARVAVQMDRSADPAALAQARLWLGERSAGLTGIEIDGVVLDPAAALLHLERLAVAGQLQDRASHYGWRVDRRPLEAMTAPLLRRLVEARAQFGDAPGTLPRLLFDVGALAHSAIYHRRGDGSIVTGWVGPDLGIKPEQALGLELGERRDQIYAGLLRSRLEGARVEPTFHRLKGCVEGVVYDYESFATADRPALDGGQIIHTTVNILERVEVAA